MIMGRYVKREVETEIHTSARCIWVLFGVNFHFIPTSLFTDHPLCIYFITEEKKNTSGMSWKVLWKVWCWSWKEALVLACFLLCERTRFRPSPLDKCMAFSALSTSCWTESFQYFFFFLRNGRSAFTAGWYNAGVTFWQGIRCRFQSTSSNYSSDYFQSPSQPRSALGWT